MDKEQVTVHRRQQNLVRRTSQPAPDPISAHSPGPIDLRVFSTTHEGFEQLLTAVKHGRYPDCLLVRVVSPDDDREPIIHFEKNHRSRMLLQPRPVLAGGAQRGTGLTTVSLRVCVRVRRF